MKQHPLNREARLSFRLALLSVPLALLSYVWVPFEVAEIQEPNYLFPLIALGEGGALVAGIAALVTGVRARRKTSGAERRLASKGLVLGAAVVTLVIGLNVLFMVVLP